MAFERATLYGIPVCTQRRIDYAMVDRQACPRTLHPRRAGGR